ncbi:UNVERIFIED_CONTAM: Desiccation protectant protein Lea14 [Sesamum calycinum]|uniref:Desiccation protectant protein Lea14 n=1 Tax=Sesamum calycinum TaxID=2727403 RepID=A0AAW2Q4S5_9LAMI
MGIVDLVTEKVAQMPQPEATMKDVDLKGLGFDGINLLAKVSVSNPYSVPIPIGEITYKVKSAERLIASGSIPDPGSLKANGETVLDVAVKVAHSALVSLVRDIAGDWDVDYLLELGMIVDLPIVGQFTIPVSYKGEMKLPTFSELIRGKSEPSEAAAPPVE